MSSTAFKGMTLLVTHYNRSESLARLLQAFVDLDMWFEHIVVSDDGSKPVHAQRLEKIKEIYNFELITSSQNRGLGNNLNKGQDAVKTPYTLYIQEDFVPKPEFKEALANAFEFMKNDPELDIARFYAYFKYPNLISIGKGFSRMLFSEKQVGFKKYYVYSDHPHLRRSTFLNKFGRYQEGISGDKTEYKMMFSFINRNGQAIYYDNFKGLLDQKNNQAEPSTMSRAYWRETTNYIVAFVRFLYRFVKLNWDYYFYRP